MNTIGEVKAAIGIPLIANGDIDSPQKAKAVLEMTDRCGDDWPGGTGSTLAFSRDCALPGDEPCCRRCLAEIRSVLLEHVAMLHAFYGEYSGCRIARKHIAWTTRGLPGSNEFRNRMLRGGKLRGAICRRAALF